MERFLLSLPWRIRTPPEVAVITLLYIPGVEPATNTPAELIEPAVTLVQPQVTAVFIGLLYWSYPWAVKTAIPADVPLAAATDGFAGFTRIWSILLGVELILMERVPVVSVLWVGAVLSTTVTVKVDVPKVGLLPEMAPVDVLSVAHDARLPLIIDQL